MKQKKSLEKLIYHERTIRLVKFLKTYFFDAYATKSYSQEGEDMILSRLFERQKKGFYVDVGAHHPERFSNTCYFYKKGWNGINIDAMPGSMKTFRKLRRRDINLEEGVSTEKKELFYYIFNEPALNGFSQELSETEYASSKYYIVKKTKIIVRPLSEILDEYLPGGVNIDFLSVDVESMDYEVLQSNNWKKYKPKAVLVEMLNSDFEKITGDPVYLFLKEKGYKLFAKSVNTAIFIASN